jgi:hypothetical protein
MNIPHDTRARLDMLDRQTAPRGPTSKTAGESKDSAAAPAGDEAQAEAASQASRKANASPGGRQTSK